MMRPANAIEFSPALDLLTDAGPLYALIDVRGQPANYQRCQALLKGRRRLVTTWPAFTEAMHFAGINGGRPMQALLANYVTGGRLLFAPQTTEDFATMDILMARYADTPMDLADASLITAANALNATRIFTLDSDFYIYRLATGAPLEVLPGPLTR